MWITVDKAQGLQQVPATLHGLLKFPDSTSYQFTSPITTGYATERSVPIQRSAGLLRVLGLAFLGGLILNLMPCVFPVLFIKGLALVQSSGHERQRMRAHGAMYALGILVSFWAIVALLLFLRAGGHHLGWGFQFQSPYFVACMALLFFFLGLSLAGSLRLDFLSPVSAANWRSVADIPAASLLACWRLSLLLHAQRHLWERRSASRCRKARSSHLPCSPCSRWGWPRLTYC